MTEPYGHYRQNPHEQPQAQPAPPQAPAGNYGGAPAGCSQPAAQPYPPAPYPQPYQQPGPPPGPAPAPRSSTRRRLLTTAGALLPVVGAGAYFVSRLGSNTASSTATGGSGGYNPGDYNPSSLPSAAGDPNAVSVSAVQAMLATANKALAGRDQRGYTSLFTGPAAAQAATLFKNLGKFRFDFAEYQLIGDSTRQFSTGDSSTVGMDIAFTHQLTGVDPGKVAEWYRWTITKDGSGNPIITGLGGSPTVNASAKYVYYPHPWDSPHDLIVHYQGNAILCAETASDAAIMMKYANEAAAAVANNLDDWKSGAGNLHGVSPGALFMHTSAADLYTWYSGKANLAGFEAGLTTPMISADYLADPTGRVMSYSGARIAINLQTSFFQDDQGEDSPYVLYKHEGFHALAFPLLSAVQSTIPLWEVEGAADFFATHGYANPVAGYLRVPDIRAYAKSGWDGNFPTDGEVYSQVETVGNGSYGLSAMISYYVYDRFGMPGVCKLLTANYEAASPDGIAQGQDNVASAIQSALGISQNELHSGWRAFMAQKIGVSA